MIEYKESTRSFFIFYVIQVNYTEVITQLKYQVNQISGSLLRDHSQIKIGNKEKKAGAELCQAQRCLVGFEIKSTGDS